jgi:hypothetical protein
VRSATAHVRPVPLSPLPLHGNTLWSAADKFSVVLEAAPLNVVELAEYCRRKGLLVEQLERWRTRYWQMVRAVLARANAPQTRSVFATWRKTCGARKKRWQRQRRCWCCPESTKRCGQMARTHDCVAAAPGDGRRYRTSPLSWSAVEDCVPRTWSERTHL